MSRLTGSRRILLIFQVVIKLIVGCNIIRGKYIRLRIWTGSKSIAESQWMFIIQAVISSYFTS